MYDIDDRIFFCTQSTPISVSLLDPAVSLSPPFNVQEHEVRKLFKQQSSRKAAGSDNMSTSTLKHCDDKLASLFMELFSASLHQHTVPLCFKAATIIPVPKKTKVNRWTTSAPWLWRQWWWRCWSDWQSLRIWSISPTQTWIHSSSPTRTTDTLMMLVPWPCTLWCSTWSLPTYVHVDTMQTCNIVS